MSNRLEYFLSILSTIPEKPGCYQYYNEKGTIIYVGKAKNLRKRISSYFQQESSCNRTSVLVKQIHDIKYIVVNSEEDALLLENNLIKQHRPRYNVLLKDDKTYPSIVVKKEDFPRIFSTRTILKDGSRYFGPYASAYTAKIMLQLIKNIYPIRTCKYPLTPEHIKAGKYQVCLDYHIKRCKGPCVGLQTVEEYDRNVAEIKEILKGNSSRVTDLLLKEMQALAGEMRFEEAQALREKYDLIENFRSKSTVVTPTLHNIDVFSFDENEHSAFINYMHIGNGAIVLAYTFEYKKKLIETKEELLGLGIIEMRRRWDSFAKEIVIPFLPNISIEGITFTVPTNRGGDKKKLLELSVQNVKQYKFDLLKQVEKFNPEQRTTRILKTIQADLHLPALPMHIECFDNSNIQGTTPVAACVIFKKAKPSKKDYRHFHIKTIVGPDDFASMAEVVRRRYTRLKKEKATLPQLVVIDGGKGQLNVATEVLRELDLLDKITIVGLAKRLEEIFFPGDPEPLVLDKNSETLRVIQHLRDEAHRFGITFHRHLRSKKQVLSELDSIQGIGSKTKEILLKKYKSVKRIREASLEELGESVGKKKAKKLFDGLHKEEI
ncbi:MAG: excinuclease ABC subunit UvrC [Tannerella sp.]|jgi:excinuclease ABC subunit C|nr:excinuclease ABC subunit UvrC [Tannerella sp.]